MPAQSQQQAPTRSTAAPPQTDAGSSGGSQSLYGNAFLQDRMRDSQVSPGKLSWQDALGGTVGGKLYDALSAQLTDDKLLGHANRLVDSGLGALKNAISGQTVTLDEKEAAALFVAEIDKGMKQVARDAVIASGLAEGIRDAVDAHPYEVALAAVAGAVAYVLSNQDLPLIETKLGLGGGHSLIAGIDPGRTMHFAVEQVRVGYRYQGDKLAAALTVDKYQDGLGVSGNMGYQLGADSRVDASARYSDRAGVRQAGVDLSYSDSDRIATISGQQTVGGDKPGSSVTASIANKPLAGDLSRSASATWRSDGSWEAAAGIGKTDKNERWSVEAFGGRDAAGNQDYGVRAMYRLRF